MSSENKEKINFSKEKKADDTEREEFCLVNSPPYYASKSREVWIQCKDCRLWQHDACTPDLPSLTTEILNILTNFLD